MGWVLKIAIAKIDSIYFMLSLAHGLLLQIMMRHVQAHPVVYHLMFRSNARLEWAHPEFHVLCRQKSTHLLDAINHAQFFRHQWLQNLSSLGLGIELSEHYQLTYTFKLISYLIIRHQLHNSLFCNFCFDIHIKHNTWSRYRILIPWKVYTIKFWWSKIKWYTTLSIFQCLTIEMMKRIKLCESFEIKSSVTD